MAKDNASLSGKISQNNQNGDAAKMTPAAFEKNILDWFKVNGRRMVTFAGSEGDARRMMAGLFYLASRNPKILTCTTVSLGNCLMQSAMTRLFPGSGNECTYNPYWNNGARCNEAQFIPMYGGILKHAYNNPVVASINCDVVYTSDVFEYQKGTNAFLKHIPFEGPDDERGEIKLVYALAELRGGGKVFEVKNMKWIESIRAKSPSGHGDYSPWVHWFEDMCRKSILKYIGKYIPRSREMDLAIQVDNAIEQPDYAKDGKVPFSGDISGLAAESGMVIPTAGSDEPSSPEKGSDAPQLPGVSSGIVLDLTPAQQQELTALNNVD